MYLPIEELVNEVRELKEAVATLQTAPYQQIEIIERPELLKRLGITEPTAIRLGKKGVIPEIRIGASVRYNWPAVVASLEKQSK